GLLHVLADQRLVERQRRVRVELAGEEPRVEAAEPGVKENRLVAEGDFPAVGAEPLEADTRRAAAATRLGSLGALSDTRQHEGRSPVHRRRGETCDEPGAEEPTARDTFGQLDSDAESMKHMAVSSGSSDHALTRCTSSCLRTRSLTFT